MTPEKRRGAATTPGTRRPLRRTAVPTAENTATIAASTVELQQAFRLAAVEADMRHRGDRDSAAVLRYLRGAA